jgi:hypothetical protein
MMITQHTAQATGLVARAFSALRPVHAVTDLSVRDLTLS